MPLSEREQRILQEIEKNLYAEDPRFAREVKRAAPRATVSGRAKIGALSFLAGFAILILFFVTRSLLLGVAAFGAMVAGIVLVAGSARSLMASEETGVGRRARAALEEWQKRVRERYKKT